jgi:hypothetical protein
MCSCNCRGKSEESDFEEEVSIVVDDSEGSMKRALVKMNEFMKDMAKNKKRNERKIKDLESERKADKKIITNLQKELHDLRDRLDLRLNTFHARVKEVEEEGKKVWVEVQRNMKKVENNVASMTTDMKYTERQMGDKMVRGENSREWVNVARGANVRVNNNRINNRMNNEREKRGRGGGQERRKEDSGERERAARERRIRESNSRNSREERVRGDGNEKEKSKTIVLTGNLKMKVADSKSVEE